MESPISLEQFQKLLPSICNRKIAAGDGVRWTPDNPTWGHCAVASLIVQNLFGGKLLRVSLEGTPFAEARSHYFNELPDGSVIDVTKQQFGGHLFKAWQPEERTREYVIGGADTRKRYACLSVRFAQALEPDNQFLQDRIYLACLYQAFLSPCQKKGVGAVLQDWGEEKSIVRRSHNEPIPGLEDLCQPTCIRFKIQSRTESMLGACGHAEERLLWMVGNNLKYYALYTAGVTAQGLPEKRPFREFTCLRCAVAMYYSGISQVNIAYMGREWVELTAEQCLQQAKAYALGQKKI